MRDEAILIHHSVPHQLIFLQQGPPHLPLFSSLIPKQLFIHALLRLVLPLQLRLPLSLTLLEFMLKSLRLQSRPFHRLLFMATFGDKVFFLLLINLCSVSDVVREF